MRGLVDSFVRAIVGVIDSAIAIIDSRSVGIVVRGSVGIIALACTACGENRTPQPEPAPVLPSCVPNRDGAIEADELPIAFGATATMYEGRNRTFDSVGTGGIWDLSQEVATDQVIAIGPRPINDEFFASEAFPAASFVVDAGGDLDGVYHQDDRALWLHGVVNREDASTLVRYTEPVALLRFPVVDGDAYETSAEIPDGKVAGLPFVGTDRVTVEVRGEGRLDVPYVQFSPTLRVRVAVQRVPSSGSPVVSRRTTLFLFECFGEVARAESTVDEPNPDFTNAAVLRRFALGATP